MSEGTLSQIVQLITALTAFGAMALSWVVALRVKKVGQQVEAVHLATNSMQDKLVAATAVASHAEGVTAGRVEQRAEDRGK